MRGRLGACALGEKALLTRLPHEPPGLRAKSRTIAIDR